VPAAVAAAVAVAVPFFVLAQVHHSLTLCALLVSLSLFSKDRRFAHLMASIDFAVRYSGRALLCHAPDGAHFI
jgi:hypothetical protein